MMDRSRKVPLIFMAPARNDIGFWQHQIPEEDTHESKRDQKINNQSRDEIILRTTLLRSTYNGIKDMHSSYSSH
jgi:hypothetical protein